MRYMVCAVRDAKADAYMSPFFAPALGVAERSFLDECDNTESILHKHPEDYELFWLGTFDSQDGRFELLERPKSVALGKRG